MAEVGQSANEAGITNSNGTTDVPANYEVCERTGFRVKPGELVKEWDGTMVRPESWEARHPQDFIRIRAERQRGSENPEPADVFIEDAYPSGVNPATDL